jgi:glycosyltransferase involved in cell wall biosynthesis
MVKKDCREEIGIEARLSVLMPVYNEEATVLKVISVVLEQSCVAELIIVDDCSTDCSWELLEDLVCKEPRVRVFRHSVNQGKGAALRTAISYASCPLVIIQDADLEYNPAEYETLIQPILANHADVVVGSRFAGGPHRVLFFWHSVGNKVLTIFSNMMTNLNLSDMESCYKVFRREIIQSFQLEENRFGFEPEIIAKVAKLGVRIYEIPISYNGRTYEEGKKINWRDGFSALRCIVKYNFFN